MNVARMEQSALNLDVLRANRMLTEREVEALYGIGVASLRAMRGKRQGPSYHKLNARCVRYKAEDVEAWIAEHRVVLD